MQFWVVLYLFLQKKKKRRSDLFFFFYGWFVDEFMSIFIIVIIVIICNACHFLWLVPWHLEAAQEQDEFNAMEDEKFHPGGGMGSRGRRRQQGKKRKRAPATATAAADPAKLTVPVSPFFHTATYACMMFFFFFFFFKFVFVLFCFVLFVCFFFFNFLVVLFVVLSLLSRTTISSKKSERKKPKDKKLMPDYYTGNLSHCKLLISILLSPHNSTYKQHHSNF